MSGFTERLEQAATAAKSLVCVGLDPDPARMPVSSVAEFNRAIVDATAGLVCAYKPNLAFYEALGLPGLEDLQKTIAHIRDAAPGVIIIGDAKRGDIGPSAQAYAKAMFQVWGFDAITINAWGGQDTVTPFIEDESKGVFVWCRGSNPGSADFQDAQIATDDGPMPLYRSMALSCREWDTKGNLGLVVGATVPEQLGEVRAACPDMPLLIPGVGAQGGDLEAAVRQGADSRGRAALINSSRGIIYASSGADFAQAAAREADKLRTNINEVLEADGKGWS
ncbi:MAG TPA: orotidine-5'-phosphate decarboxylase [Dehalococcoidia bacterium]|jgi:orotidine-5'-phosphate decarboxylase|nr:orotidine-5'-phosphate decarboxylase [Dehalococcoidia bacterium]PKB83424.1 MAG: orotidine-5'-phosphate decarboxylase [SAR202 cluster bacterium MP-SInd-SRR3963457-G1]PKB83473.1 MAG: orotidine-5'-phosphate decarboxylase [SAR202 cluster bacterium MP-NPac-SRR3961935-G1]RUA28678.1 MAG: orotidine-5'-phosphate decarboxylase [Chloroflexota bacterium]HIM63518.1 orotidine-5'-phosphate decarboxylase [Dehalococcoidia bacterium]|tara:strand:+ start:286 stop:1122 length:837 start_codon:yes stop_codon:yes gene_type:complete